MQDINGDFLKRVACRPALYKDTLDVNELTSTIWEGHDYVPRMWEKWLTDSQGLLVVAEFSGRVVGLVKLSYINPEEWWLEGLRVHPKFEGRGIASRLHDYILAYWQTKCGGLLRLATGSHRLAVHHLCERTGFIRIAEFSIYAAATIHSIKVGNFSPIKSNEKFEAFTHISHSPITSLSSNLMNLGWQWVTVCEQQVSKAIDKGKAWWWMDREGVLLLSEDTNDEGEKVPTISTISTSLESLSDFLYEYRALAEQLGYRHAAWIAPLNQQVMDAMQASGFEQDWELSLFIYEKGSKGGVV